MPLTQIPGRYKLINHGKAITPAIVDSTLVELHSDGRVSGSAVGSWEYLGDDAMAVTLDGTVYSGVLSRQWSEDVGDSVVTFSALSHAGVAVWGSQLPPQP